MTAADVERWDSLSHIDMILMVEQDFGIRIPTRSVSRMQNVGDLVALIQRLAP
jgi:acyl carrier protein